MKRQYFGTDGVRGPYGGPVINESFAARLGAAAGRWIGGSGRVVIGRDTRASGESLAGAGARGRGSPGLAPVLFGAAPLTSYFWEADIPGAVLGVVITASHNPACDNGIKFFSRTGVKLTDEDEAAIEQALPSDVPASTATFASADVLPDYMAATGAILPANALRGWKIVLDTANGATCATSPAVLRALGAEVIGLGDSPDGKNINAGVGSEHPGPLAQRVREVGARLGIAHDGDGDRCILCDERGEVLDGDEILTILATHAHRQGKLAAQTLVITVQSNLGVDAALGALGGRVARTDVGDRYVIERMFATGATLGGESSGHIICSEISPTGDGLVAALKTIEVMLATGRPLSELRGALAKFPQRSLALKVREKRPLETLPTLPRAIEALERELGSQGRVLVRYSGTEAKLRLLVEGPTDVAVQAGLARLEAATRSDLEVL